MPIRIVSSTGGNWNAPTAWTTGVAPTSVDTVEFANDSGGIVVNVASTVAGINFSNYLNTITFSALLTVAGTVSLGTGGYTQDGGSGLALTATNKNPQPLTSNGVTWSRLIQLSGTNISYTLNDQWNNTGTVSFGGSGTLNVNGATLGIAGDLRVTSTNTIQGSSSFLFNGSGNWTHTAVGYIQNNVVIDTTGEVSTGNLYYRSGTFRYNSGTFTPLIDTTLTTSGTTTFSNVNSIYWQNITLATTTTLASTNSNINIIGTFSNNSSAITFNTGTYGLWFKDSTNVVRGSLLLSGAITFTLPNSFDVYNVRVGTTTNNFTLTSNTMSVWGSFSVNTTTGIVSGTTNLVLAGTNSYISGNSTGPLRNNLFINCDSTTFNNLYYNTGTIRYITGTVSHVPGSTLNLSGSTILNTGTTSINNPSGMEWNNVAMTGTSQVFTHSSITRISGTLSLSGTTGLVNNGSEINVRDLSVTTTAANTGTTKFNFTYAGGRWNHTTTGTLANPVEIDESISFGTNIYYRTGTFSTLSESVGSSVITTGSNFFISASTIFNTPGLRFNNMLVSGTTTITLWNDLIINGTMSLFSAASSTLTFTRNGYNLLFTNSIGDVVGTLNLGTNGFGGTGFISNTYTFTLPQDLNVLNCYFGSQGGTNTINGSTIYVHKTFYSTGTSLNTGTTQIVMTSSNVANLTSISAGMLRNNITISKTPGSSAIMSDPFYYDAGTLNWTSGEVVIGGLKTISTTLGFTWSIPQEARTGGLVVGFLSLSGATAKRIRLNANMSISDRLTLQSASLTLDGTYSLLFKDTSENITGSLWLYANTTFTQNNNIELLDLQTAINANSQTTTINGTSPNNIIYINRSLYNGQGFDGTTTGKSKIVLCGTGTWSQIASGANQHKLDTTIDTQGTIYFGRYSSNPSFPIGETPFFGGATFSYVRGNVVSTNGGLNIIADSTLDTGTMSLNKYSIRPSQGSTPNLNLKSKLLAGEIRCITSCGFYGTHGFEVDKFDISTSFAGSRVLLQAGLTYKINREFVSYTNFTQGQESSSQVPQFIRSWNFPNTSSPTMSYLILSPTATHSVLLLSAQNIDSRGGKTIRTFGATLSNALNWSSITSDINSVGWVSVS